MVDFIAKAFHLPLLNPYLEKEGDLSHGVNFAVGGSTAIDTSFLAGKNITALNTNSSLSVQLGWFRTHLKSICASKAGKSFQDAYKLVPDVIHATKNAVKEVIHQGAAQVVVMGYFRLGCFPFYLVTFASNDASMYDEFQCIKIVNEFNEYHNLKLQAAIKELQHQFPTVSISYGDTYSAFTWLLQHAPSLGFEKDGMLKACCGAGNNAYNFNLTRYCGSPGVSACADPLSRLSWDGFHLTHHAFKHLTSWLLAHTF